MTQPPLVVHLIYSLGTGGLENGLVNIINRAPLERYRHAIVCIHESGPFEQRLQGSVPVIALHKRPGHDLRCHWRLLQTLRRLRPAIVHSRNLAALEMQFTVALLPGIRRVHGEHGRDVRDLDGSNWKFRLLRRLARPLISRWIAVSQDLAAWLGSDIGVAGSRVAHIYNGVDTERFSPAASSDARAVLPAGFAPADALVIGTVGRLAAVKDQSTLVSAFAAIAAYDAPLAAQIRLLLVGDGPERARLTAQVERLGIAHQVWFAGDRDDVPALLRAMDVFVLPSLAEGTPNTVLEAMATGLPVIATAVGGSRELVEEGSTGLLIAVGDTDALTQALLGLLRDPAARESMGQAAVAKIREQFSWSQTVARYLAEYDAVLARG